MEVIPQEVFKVRKECKIHRNWSDLAIHNIKRGSCMSIAICRDCGFVLRSVSFGRDECLIRYL